MAINKYLLTDYKMILMNVEMKNFIKLTEDFMWVIRKQKTFLNIIPGLGIMPFVIGHILC